MTARVAPGLAAGVRVGVVTTSYPRFDGDPAGSFVAGHVGWLRAQGAEVEVIAAGEGAGAGVVRIPGRLFYEGGAPEAMDRRGLRALPDAALFSARLVAAVARRARRWDAAIAHWLLPSAAAAALATRRLPLLAIAHSGDVHLARQRHLTRPLAALLAARRARLAFVTDALRQRFLAGAGGLVREPDTIVCPMGIDAAHFAALRGAAPVSDRATPAILFLGRLVPIKGVDSLIDAMSALQTPARLVIAGAGPSRPQLAARATASPAAHRIALAGELHGPARDAALAAADLLVLPSLELPGGRSEGAPLAVLEAMAAGVPVVATATGGLRALPAAAITRVPPGDPAALAAAIDALLADPARRARQIAAARTVAAAADWAEVGATLWRHLSATAT